jgi:hypothetical protein
MSNLMKVNPVRAINSDLQKILARGQNPYTEELNEQVDKIQEIK